MTPSIAVQHALKAGALLLRAKALVQHGEWGKWLQANCTAAPRTCRAYMRLAAAVPQLPTEERQRVADLPLREAIRAIATSPDKPPQREYRLWDSKLDEPIDRAVDALRKASRVLSRTARDINKRRPLRAACPSVLRKQFDAAMRAVAQLVEAGT